MYVNIYSLITIIGIAYSFFISVIMLLRRDLSKSKYFLMGMMLSICLSITYEILYPTDLYIQLPLLVHTYIPTQFLIGPFFLLYVKSVLYPGRLNNKMALIHFIPFLAVLIYMAPLLTGDVQSKMEFSQTYLSPDRGTSKREWIIWISLQISLISYNMKIFVLLRKYGKTLKENLSTINEPTFVWLNFMYIGCSLSIFSFLFIDFFMLRGTPLIAFNDFISTSMVCIIIFFGTYGTSKLETITFIEDKESQKPSQGLADKYEEILSAIKRNGCHLNPDLTLIDLANDLNLSRTDLSGIINRGGNLTFYELINKMRVEELKTSLSRIESNKTNIIDLAFDCGFNSKSTMQRAFKRETGMTPLQFRLNANG